MALCGITNGVHRPLESGRAFRAALRRAQGSAGAAECSAENPAVVSEFRARLKDHVNSGWTLTRGTFATKLA